MEILKILETSTEDLYPEDLDFFETELATGDYSEEYAAQCRQKIQELRKWISGDSNEKMTEKAPKTNAKKIQQGTTSVKLGDIIPDTENLTAAALSGEQQILHTISSMRQSDTYKSDFKGYLLKTEEIDAHFVDLHYGFFQRWELDTILSVRQMGENFLEKYFDVLDHDKIALYQEFSENFYMKHFSRLKSSIVLTRGRNSWRKKGKRSKQLDVFLRLKGVKA